MSDDQKLIENLAKIREVLGQDVTDIANEMMVASQKTNDEIDNSVKEMSSLASSVSAFVVRKRAEKQDQDKLHLFDKLSTFAKQLGNAQFRLTQIAKKNKQMEDLAQSISTEGFNLADEIMHLQDEARNIWGVLRELGFELPESDLQQLMQIDS